MGCCRTRQRLPGGEPRFGSVTCRTPDAHVTLKFHSARLLLPFTLPSLSFSPRRYRPHGVGNWSGHIPFARDLIDWLRPGVLVELGTHLGESYFAFCQAIVESGTKTEAYAVDTWEGDAHTGAYGDEVFRDVESHNAEHYRAFSHLLRMTFDEAASQFENDSIDLLHIDGLHTYEAVSHDFETWWPKVRPSGIVLLHDSFARHGDFGVWKLLAELRERSLLVGEFVHSNGLGIVHKPGERRLDEVVSILLEGDECLLAGVRSYYEICANHLEHKFWSARRDRPSDWDLAMQLFWRGEGESFTENASLRVAQTVSAEPSRISFTVPALPVTELRLDLTDRPAFLTLQSISAVRNDGEPLWSIVPREQIDELRSAGLHCVAAGDGSGVLVFDAPEGASFVIPKPKANSHILPDGGTILVEISGLDPGNVVSRIRAASEEEVTKVTAELGNRDRALGEAQRLSLQRLAELQQYHDAFATAERLSLERLAELERYDRVLGETQRLANERLAELQKCDQAVRETQQLANEKQAAWEAEQLRTAELEHELRVRNAELEEKGRAFEDVQARLGAIESSRAWRLIKRFAQKP